MAFYEDFPLITVIGWGLAAMRPARPESKKHGYIAYDTGIVSFSDNDRQWFDISASVSLDSDDITNVSTIIGANVSDALDTLGGAITTHIGDTANPHSVTKAQVGLSNVPNTDATLRANHTGTQLLSTISDAGALAALNTVDTAQINDNAITSGKLAAGLVKDLALVSPVSGDVFYYNGTNLVRLGVGTDGQVLTLSSGLPAWAAASGGASQLSDLSDVGATTKTNRFALMADGSFFQSRAIVVADVSDAGALAALNTVDTAQINDNAVTTAKLAAGAVKDLGGLSLVSGDILYYNGTNLVRLGVGTDGQFLKLVSGLPAWATAAGGGNVSGGGSSTDNALARWDGATGTLLQDSLVIVSDLGYLTAPKLIVNDTDAILDLYYATSQNAYMNFYQNSVQTHRLHVDASNFDIDEYNGGVFNQTLMRLNSTLNYSYANFMIQQTGGAASLGIKATDANNAAILFYTSNIARFAFFTDAASSNVFYLHRYGGGGNNPIVFDYGTFKTTLNDDLVMNFGTPAANEVLKRDASGNVSAGKVDLSTEIATLSTETPVDTDELPFFDTSDSSNAKKATIADILALGGGGGINILAVNTSASTTTAAVSGTWVTVTGTSTSVTFSGDKNVAVIVAGIAFGKTSSNVADGQFGVLIQGTTYNLLTITGQSGVLPFSTNFTYILQASEVTAGSTTVAVQILSSTGTRPYVAQIMSGFRLIVLEF